VSTPEPTPQQGRESPAYRHWKEIATAIHGIYPHEPRYATILTMLNRCEEADKNGNETAFLRAKQQLLNFIAASTPRVKSTPAAQSA
jgi:hypothetical protein